MSNRARKLVVAALIVREDGKLLLSQRREDQALPLFWEFPGGKIEPGEAPEAALVREIQEELGVAVRVGRIWEVLFHAYPDYDVYMLVYACRIVAGTPRAVEVKDFVWIEAGQLGGYNVLPADAPLCERLTREGTAGLIE
jgi:8-oxo-dGTP diphosphatase